LIAISPTASIAAGVADMFAVGAINLLAIWLAYIARNKSNAIYLKFAFVVVFLFLALRYNYGNDYQSYYEMFRKISSDSNIGYFRGDLRAEAGWILVCRLFKRFGYFALIAAIAMFNSVVIYRFVAKYVSPRYYWFAVFFYTFNPNIMLIQLSAIRQSIAISIFLLSVEYLYRRMAIRYCLCILVAALFHATALVLLPLVLLGVVNFRFNRLTAIAVFAGYLSLFRVRSDIVASLYVFVLINVGEYSSYLRESDANPGLGYALYTVLLLLVLYYAKYSRREHLLLTKVGLFYFACFPLALLATMLSRFGFYFAPFLVAVFPHMFGNIRFVFARRMIIAVVVFHTVYSYSQFMNSATYSEWFSTYQTIFTR
jgi:hypothetical protein